MQLPYTLCCSYVDRALRLASYMYYPPTVCQLHLFQNRLHSHHLSVINSVAKEQLINLEILKNTVVHANANKGY